MINLRATLLGIIVFYILINIVCALPDLVAEIDYYPKNASVGDTITVITTVKNVGDTNVTNLFIRNIIPMMTNAPYPPTNISANSEKNFTFNWTLRYGKDRIRLIVDEYNQINETNETNNEATLIFDFPVIVKTDKKEYRVGEQININIVGNNGPGHISVRYASLPFKIFKFENESWNEIAVDNDYDPNGQSICYNGTLIPGPLFSWISPTCKDVAVNSSWVWNQTYRISANLICGNQTYNRWAHIPVESGMYKIGMYYYNKHVDYFLSCSDLYAESENFTILQNCSSDSDCAYGEKCINETCLSVQNYCENNSHCDDNQVCVNNTCSNLSCEFWQVAENSSCVLRYGYCENDGDCNFDQTCLNHTCQNMSCNYWQIAENHSCVLKSGYCENSNNCQPGYYCSSYTCHMSSNSGGGTREINYIQPTNTNATTTTLKAFSDVIPIEIEGLTVTFNLGKDSKGADVTATVGNKTSKSTANANGTVTINLPGYGQGEIIISKAGYKNLTKTINVYTGTLNITKISGEKYGDEFIFKVTANKTPVQEVNVEIFGEILRTDEQGIVKKKINRIQQDINVSASAKNYKGSKITFEVKVIGKLYIRVPEKVTQDETITIIVTNENNNSVPNTNVSINGVEHTADANGKIEYNVTTTSVTLKASKEGYIPSEQKSVTVEVKIECGNGICEAGETKENCLQDCIKCGDGYCDNGEDYKTCPGDCKKPEEFPWLLIILIAIMLLILVYFLIFRKNKKQ